MKSSCARWCGVRHTCMANLVKWTSSIRPCTCSAGKCGWPYQECLAGHGCGWPWLWLGMAVAGHGCDWPWLWLAILAGTCKHGWPYRPAPASIGWLCSAKHDKPAFWFVVMQKLPRSSSVLAYIRGTSHWYCGHEDMLLSVKLMWGDSD